MAVAQIATSSEGEVASFRHEAFLYRTDDEYCAYLAPFIDAGLESGDAVLVAVPEARLGLLRDAFVDMDESQVRFAEMETLGHNPAWIIPVWAEFVEGARADGRAMRGVGEPIWNGRSDEELVECERHEALLNLVFAETEGFQLLCPYDASTLDPEVIAEAHRTHPHVSDRHGVVPSPDFVDRIPALLDRPLAPVPADAELAEFGRNSLGAVRRWAADLAVAAGLTDDRTDDLMVAISEAMTNSVRHGGGGGELVVWRTAREVLCEIRDGGQVGDPLAGRLAPPTSQLDGRGLWIMNRVADLVQMRAWGKGQVVRLHFAI